MNKFKKILIVGLAGFMLAGIGYRFFYHTQEQQSLDATGIMDFEDGRDAVSIKNIFDRDWHWLISEYSPDYDVDYTLRYRSSSKLPEERGNLTIKVGYEGDQFVGFVAYYKETFYRGRILFIDVIPEYRSKGWAQKLMRYAMHDLIERGATSIVLVTRTTNHSAQKLYNRLGFHEVSRRGGFVDFEYSAQ